MTSYCQSIPGSFRRGIDRCPSLVCNTFRPGRQSRSLAHILKMRQPLGQVPIGLALSHRAAGTGGGGSQASCIPVRVWVFSDARFRMLIRENGSKATGSLTVQHMSCLRQPGPLPSRYGGIPPISGPGVFFGFYQSTIVTQATSLLA